MSTAPRGGRPAAWRPVIGLEIHLRLSTATKLFCADVAAFGAEPNTHVCPVCLGLPGALPVLNTAAVEFGVTAALALGCQVHETSRFARKNYFYADLPKGYQITQFDRPLATGGTLAAVGIRRVHLEEDAGKSLHGRVPGRTALDFNRAGVPLLEIVTEPDIATAAAARAFLTALRQLLAYTGISDCDMEKGSLRVDANVSVRRRGSRAAGVRTEIKNLNSFAGIERALDYEIDRQTAALERGGTVTAETLLWDDTHGVTRALRSKELSDDYRYFSEPDLPPLTITAGRIAALRAALPELPAAKQARFRRDYGLPAYDAEVLTATRALAAYYEGVAAVADAKTASNWVMTDVLGWLNRRQLDIAAFPIAAARLGELVGMVDSGTLSRPLARRVFERMIATGADAPTIVAEAGLARVTDALRLADWAAAVAAAHPALVERCRAGDDRPLHFLVGQLMKLSGGSADPQGAAAAIRQQVDDATGARPSAAGGSTDQPGPRSEP